MQPLVKQSSQLGFFGPKFSLVDSVCQVFSKKAGGITGSWSDCSSCWASG